MQRSIEVERFRVAIDHGHVKEMDPVVVEEPMEIRLNGEALSVTMRTPGDDENLTRGFLFTEQIIDGMEQILDLTMADNVVSVRVPPAILEKKCWVRNFYASSSCGVCGKASIDQLKFTRPKIDSTFRISVRTLCEVPHRMRVAQELFEKTGGLHAAVLFTTQGEILRISEDIGRHNAVDKVIGWAMGQRLIPAHAVGLFVSGRTSFEILQKGIAAGIPLIAAVSAPSSLAVRLAQEYQVTLVGFVRGDSLNVYSHEGRVHGGS